MNARSELMNHSVAITTTRSAVATSERPLASNSKACPSLFDTTSPTAASASAPWLPLPVSIWPLTLKPVNSSVSSDGYSRT